MPGLVCVTGNNPNIVKMANDVAKNVFASEFANMRDIDYSGLSLRAIYNQSGEPANIFEGCDSIIAYWGYPEYEKNIINKNIYLSNEKYIVDNLDSALKCFGGNFQLLFYNKRKNEVYFIVDKCSTHPWYILPYSGNIIAAPDPMSLRIIRNYGWKGEIDTDAISEFMASGFLWKDRTYFKDVFRLLPGEYHRFSSGEYKTYKYWKPNYNTINLPKENRKSLLIESLKNDFSRVPEGYGIITLSGGLDSRGLLGMAGLLNKKVDSISYTFGTDLLPHSDAYLAREIARISSVDHKLYISKGDHFVNSLYDVIRATGGETDVPCAQESFLGMDFYNELSQTYDYLLRGDELWGGGDKISSLDEACVSSYLFNLDDFSQPAHLLLPDYYKTLNENMKARKYEMVDKLRKEHTITSFNDIRDLLCWGNYEARMVSSGAYYRRPFIPHITPFLFDDTLSVVSRLPVEDRMRKSLFREAMGSLFPELFITGDKVSRSNAGYVLEYQIRNNAMLRDLIYYVLIADVPDELGVLLNKCAFHKWVMKILNTSGNNESSKGRKYYYFIHSLNRLLRKMPAIRSRVLNAARATGRIKFPVVNSDFIFRLTILAISIRQSKLTPINGRNR